MVDNQKECLAVKTLPYYLEVARTTNRPEPLNFRLHGCVARILQNPAVATHHDKHSIDIL